MVSKGAKQEKSPQRSPKKEVAKTYRKSPSRAVKSKSPSRLTANSPPSSPKPRRSIRQSPSRVTSTPKKSPARRSPARVPSSRPDKNKSNVPERLTRASSRSRQEIESETDDEVLPTVTSEPLSNVRGRQKKAKEPPAVIPKYREQTPEIGSYINLIRRSATKSLGREIDHIDHLKRESSTSSIRKLTELSDEEDVLNNDVREKSVRKSEPRLIDKITPNEFGQWRALLSTISIPLLFVAFSVFCNEKQCSFTKSPEWSRYASLATYFDFTITTITLCFIGIIVMISAIPFGGPRISGLPNKHTKFNYVMNGLFTFVVVGVILILLETLTNVRIIENILKKYFQFYTTLTVLGVILSMVLYVRSFYVPLCSLKSDALINGAVYNFYHGREINPRIFGNIDVKISLMRFCCITGILLNAIFLYKSISFKILTDGDIDYKSIKYNETLIALALMQIVYYIDFFFYESAYVTTFIAQYEAVGFEFVLFMMAGPVLGVGCSKYVFDYGVSLPRWQLFLSSVLFVAGLILYRNSNYQKHQFRLNPYHPAVSHLESIPTSQGRKLLVSGYWGIVRHPNFLGDILIQLAFVSFVYNAVPVLIYVLDILYLFDRARQIGQICQQKYGSSWERYCQRVKYSLIPKVY